MKDADILLLIDDDISQVASIQSSFEKSSEFSVEWVNQLSSGLKRVDQGGVEVILLKLDLPDSNGIETFDRIFSAAPHIPILILSRFKDLETAQQAVKRGAQDYVDMSHLNSHSILHALNNMIYRKAAE